MSFSKNSFLFLSTFFFGQLFCASEDHTVFHKERVMLQGLAWPVKVVLTLSGVFNVYYETRPTPGDPILPLVCQCNGLVHETRIQAWSMSVHNDKHLYPARTRGVQELEIIKSWTRAQRARWRSLHTQAINNYSSPST